MQLERVVTKHARLMLLFHFIGIILLSADINKQPPAKLTKKVEMKHEETRGRISGSRRHN
jgi:uncharacterized protein YhhL (DUF1145 family)